MWQDESHILRRLSLPEIVPALVERVVESNAGRATLLRAVGIRGGAAPHLVEPRPAREPGAIRAISGAGRFGGRRNRARNRQSYGIAAQWIDLFVLCEPVRNLDG